MSWKSKDLSDESIKPHDTSDNSLNLRLGYFINNKSRVKFNRGCLKTDSVGSNSKKINLYIAYEI